MDESEKQKALTAKWAAMVWQNYRQGLPLEGEAVEVAYCMEHHREWWPIWESLAASQDSEIIIEGPEGPVNPLLHVHIDATVKRQVDQGNPKEVREIYNLLHARGFEEFDAIHVIDLALTEEIWTIARNNEVFKESRYVANARHYAKNAMQRRK